MDGQVFANRREAGTVLAAALKRYKDRDDVVVLALPRGGVPVGYEVAKRLGAPLDVFVVRSSACRAIASWRWARSRPAACASSIPALFRGTASRRPRSSRPRMRS